MAKNNKSGQILDSFTDLANLPSFLGSSEPEVTDVVWDEQDFAAAVLDTKDLIAEPGNIVGVSGPISELTISARQAIFEPAVIEQMLATHAPYRTTVNPFRCNFDENGQVKALANANSVDYQPVQSKNIPTGPFGTQYLCGIVIRAVINDTQRGEGTFEIATSAGFEAEYVLADNTTDSTVCLLNHRIDFTAQSQVTATDPVAPATNATVEEIQAFTPSADQFYFSPGFDNKYTLTGSNVILHVYPLYMTRPLQALVMACLTNDRMEDLAALIAAGYEI